MKRHAIFKFCLYVAGQAPNSSLALANLTAICKEYLPDQYEIDIVDVFRDPQRALADDVFMTPTLIKLQPNPPQCIIGTLSQTQSVLQALEIQAE